MSSPVSAETPIAAPARPAPMTWWASVLIGIAAAVVGLLPWIVSGMRLPLQNLAAGDAAIQPIVLLPFSQYELITIIGLLVTGSAVGGITARALHARLPRGGATLLFAGVLAVQLIAVIQTTVAVRGVLEARPESVLYLATMIADAVLAILLGALVFFLVALAPRAGALVGLSMAAITTGYWLGTLLLPSGGVLMQPELALGISSVLRWVPPVLVGVAIAWTGVNTIGRILAVLFSLVVLWIAPALTTAVFNAFGNQVLLHEPATVIQYGITVFFSAATMPDLVLPWIVVALVVAAVGLLIRWMLRARAASAAPAAPEPPA